MNDEMNGDNRCELCGGKMEWCSICKCWTATCCDDYGTCACS